MQTLKVIAILAVFIATSMANQEPDRSVEQMVRNSVLVVEGIASKTEELSVEEVKGKGEPLKIHKRMAIMKVDKAYKGKLTPEEAKSGNLTITFTQVDDTRYKGDRVPPLKEGGRYFLFIEVFDTSAEQRSAVLHTKNNVREAADVTADPTAKKALQATEPK